MWFLTMLLKVFKISCCCFVYKLHLNIASLQSPTHKFLNTGGERELFLVCKIILLGIKITCCNHIHCGLMKSETLWQSYNMRSGVSGYWLQQAILWKFHFAAVTPSGVQYIQRGIFCCVSLDVRSSEGREILDAIFAAGNREVSAFLLRTGRN